MSLLQNAQALRPQLSAWRRHLHQNPEPSGLEFNTAEFIEAALDALDIPHRRVGETGVAGFIHGEKPGGRVIALRADTDALRVPETKAVPYASGNPGVMHACGHDVHTAALLGAAKLLVERKGEFGGEIRLFFQQAEEIGAGARQFVAAGLLEGVGQVFGTHVASDLPVGQVAAKAGGVNASVDHFTIRVKGAAAHVSTPHKGVDALYIAAQTVVALQALVTRRTSPTDPVIIGVGKLEAGTAYNIVAEDAVLEGTTRTFSPETRRGVNAQIQQTAELTAALYGGAATVEWEDFASPLINHEGPARRAAALIQSGLGEDALVPDRQRSLGGDDFAEMILDVPGVYVHVGSGSAAVPGSTLPHHNGGFDIDEGALPISAWLYAAYALGWLAEGE